MTDYLAAAMAMLGPAQNRYADASAWDRLQEQLGVALPSDYRSSSTPTPRFGTARTVACEAPTAPVGDGGPKRDGFQYRPEL